MKRKDGERRRMGREKGWKQRKDRERIKMGREEWWKERKGL